MSLYINNKKYCGRGLSAYDQAVVGGYADTESSFNKALASLPNYLNNVVGYSTLSNNSFYVPQDIRSWYDSGLLWTKISQGCVDLYPGMTFNVTNKRLTYGNTKSGIHKILILGINNGLGIT